MKRILLILTILMVAFSTGCNKEKETLPLPKKDADAPQINNDENILKTQKVSGVEFTLTSFITEKNVTTYTASVVNKSNKEINLNSPNLLINFYEDDKVIGFAEFDLIGETMAANYNQSISGRIEDGLSNVNKVEFVLNIKK